MTDSVHYAEDYPLAPLEEDCRLLGSLLDDCLKIEVGEALFNKVERIRALAQCSSELAAKHDAEASAMLSEKMAAELEGMSLEEAVPLIRACGHYLNLTGIAETHHSVRTSRQQASSSKSFDEVFSLLLAQGITPDELYTVVCKMNTEIVLTAHPTQVNRRTLQYKHTRIAHLLASNDRPDMTAEEKEVLIEDLVREITALWQTDELRRRKPTPLDEARGGLHIVEQSLWAAVPAYLRRLSTALKRTTGRELPINATPLTFASWMGGDRDGNPNVTAKVTHNVACLARWMAADLFLREVDVLRFELSQSHASDEVWRMARDIQAQEAEGDAKLQPQRNDLATPGATLRRQSMADGSLLQPTGVPSALAPVAVGNDRPHESMPSSIPVPSIGPFVLSAEGEAQEVGSPPSHIMWSPRAPSSSASSPDHSSGELPMSPFKSESELSPQSLTNGHGGTFTGSVGDMRTLQRPAAQPSGKPMLPVDSKGRLLSPDAIKRRGMKAATYHKSSIEALLHPRHAGATPYRIVLGDVRQRLLNTRRRMEDILAGAQPSEEDEWYASAGDILRPLTAAYWSLWECGGGIVAEGRLLDLIRRVHCFGVSLMRMDVRQESSRHTDALDAITRYLDLGSYAEWDEERRLQFLIAELEGRRPLIPGSMPMSEEVREVVDTFRTAAELGTDSVSAYVISMATRASDVLAVELLQREARFIALGQQASSAQSSAAQAVASFRQRVVPLFETLDDLQNAGGVVRRLFAVPWYRRHLRAHHGEHQEVMMGYSDSGKDAGRLAAAWALYNSQEQLVDVCREAGVRLTLFHGRGGTIGRGGGPMYLAIQSQPPGSVQGALRITEQGEMVQAKFGIPAVAQRQLEIFSTAVLLATESPPKPPRKAEWRLLMDELSATSCAAYRAIVFEHPDFIPYFRAATPEEELGGLNIGSRPARRKKGGGVETLRAIPWIFAWTQTRLLLPAWLGIGEALVLAFNQGKRSELKKMYEDWPFFQSTIDLVEMLLAKADMRIASLYDTVLVHGEREKQLGRLLRDKFVETVDAVLQVTGHHRLCENNPTLRRLIEMRNPYIDPINMVQAEILKRLRENPDDNGLRDALLISINGIAAGQRNTG